MKERHLGKNFKRVNDSVLLHSLLFILNLAYLFEIEKFLMVSEHQAFNNQPYHPCIS